MKRRPILCVLLGHRWSTITPRGQHITEWNCDRCGWSLALPTWRRMSRRGALR